VFIHARCGTVIRVSMEVGDLDSCRRMPVYRAGIWLYRLSVIWTIAPLPFRLAGVRLVPPPVAAVLALFGTAMLLGGYFLVSRAGTQVKREQGGDGWRHPPLGMVVRDVLWLGHR
jgi:hypothetical protein